MKKLLSLLLAFLMLFQLVSCANENENTSIEDGNNPLAIEQVDPVDEPYVEEVPSSNALDAANPIPADTGTLSLTPTEFPEANLILNLPEGVTARLEEDVSGSIFVYVTDNAGLWQIRFEPVIHLSNALNNAGNNMYYAGQSIKQDWSENVQTTLGGFSTSVWANNILPGWLYPDNEQDVPAVDMVVDYGETLVGRWYGMHIRLTAQNPTEDTNIYEVLYLRHVRAVLNNFEAIATPDGQTASGGGITATLPARWDVKTGGASIVTSVHSDEFSGSINFTTAVPADPAQTAENWGDVAFTRAYNGKEYYCVLEENGDTDDPDALTYYTLSLFSEFSEERCLHVFVNLRGFYPEDYEALLDYDVFVDVMNSIAIDPSGYQAPGTASADGFHAYVNELESYDGGETEVEIPAVIGDMEITTIAWGAFAGNESITSVVIPEGVTAIDGLAFENCINLETVVFPESLMSIGAYAFQNCPKLTNVVLPDAVAFVGGHAFDGSGSGSFTGSGALYDYGCFEDSSFDTISFAAGAELYGDYMFAGSTASEVNLPEDLYYLSMGAFSNCQNIRSLVLPDSLREIGESCFTNMSCLNITLPEGLESIPYNCFSSTTMDTLVIPESVTEIGDYAIFDANYVLLKNPNVILGDGAIDAEYLCISDAKNFVFPDYTAIWAQNIYLEGIYDPADIQGNLAAQGISYQVYLPMDATLEESAALDSYLLTIGMEEIAWIGTSSLLIPQETESYQMDGNTITGYTGTSPLLSVPYNVMQYDGTFWYTQMVSSIADGAFANSGITVAYFPGNCWDGVGARILEGNDGLTDIWFNTVIVEDMNKGTIYNPETFAGVPETMTVHIPSIVSEADRPNLEDYLKSCGLPETAVFDYYSLR